MTGAIVGELTNLSAPGVGEVIAKAAGAFGNESLALARALFASRTGACRSR